MLKKTAKRLAFVLLAVALCLVINFVYTLLFAYRPKSVQTADIQNAKATPFSEKSISVLSFNVGCGLFSCDFGDKSGVRSDAENVIKNTSAMAQIIALSKADAVMLQEVDFDSKRSFYFDQKEYYSLLPEYSSAFALDKKVKKQMMPFLGGKINSGNQTLCKSQMASALRVSLPDSSFFDSFGAERPCALVSYLPIAESTARIVLVNLRPSGRELSKILSLMKEERQKGNFVIAAGDFYKTDKNALALFEQNGFLVLSEQASVTRRSVNEPYDENFSGEKTLCDFFIISDNLEAKTVRTVDQQFRFSYHNPIYGVFELKK